jgi:hypothetical protein
MCQMSYKQISQLFFFYILTFTIFNYLADGKWTGWLAVGDHVLCEQRHN